MSPDLLALADGGTSDIPRDELLAMLVSGDSRRWSPRSVDDVDVLHTTVDDGLGVVVYRWDGYGTDLVYTLVWDLDTQPPLLVRALVTPPSG